MEIKVLSYQKIIIRIHLYSTSEEREERER